MQLSLNSEAILSNHYYQKQNRYKKQYINKYKSKDCILINPILFI